MRILAFSDLHHSRARAGVLVEAAEQADLVVGAGDFCNMRKDLDAALALLAGITAPFVVVPGNAESVTELEHAALPNMRVLHGASLEIVGLKIFGLGYGVPETPFGTWSCDLSEAQAAAMLTAFTDADVLITHSPPKGVADVTSMGQSVGSTAIRNAITQNQPRLALCGHIHDSWGAEGRIGETHVVNLGPKPNWFEFQGPDRE